MIFEGTKALQLRIAEVSGRRIQSPPQIFEDTSSYMNIVSGSVVRIGGNDYYVITDARENRFGVDDQPKFWVKYALDLTTGMRKLIKLVFYEEFIVKMGLIRVRCKRSPRKEAEILDVVRDDPRFMQGLTLTDPVGNLVRVIDVISGSSLYHYLDDLDMAHEAYFFDLLPEIMRKVTVCIDALAALQQQGLHHGDVRSDHIWIEHGTGRFAWIDFDYEVSHTDYDLWSMGNLIIRVIGKDTHRVRDIDRRPGDYPMCRESITPEDHVLLYNDRIANLRKLFPYVPRKLNDIAMRFSVGAKNFYKNFEELSEDMHACF
ncbi:MAG: hypothetical protein P8Y80_14940 [Acidobacteriota bacterium]|jgi:hypothetical protein